MLKRVAWCSRAGARAITVPHCIEARGELKEEVADVFAEDHVGVEVDQPEQVERAAVKKGWVGGGGWMALCRCALPVSVFDNTGRQVGRRAAGGESRYDHKAYSPVILGHGPHVQFVPACNAALPLVMP